jgi:hypothetical protein
MKPSLQAKILWARVVTPADAVRFIDAAGYCLLFPIKRVPLPSLYYACARRQAFKWDKYTEKIWGWKNELPRRRRAFYAKYFKMRGTFISLEMLLHFLASAGSPIAPDDFERFYAAGRISHDARTIWRTLAEHGPLPTLELRHACKMESKAGNARFKRAIQQLNCLLAITHFGAEQETAAWASNRFELTARAFPKQARAARRITPAKARAALAAKYREWHPEADWRVLARLFGWSRLDAQAALLHAERKVKG